MLDATNRALSSDNVLQAIVKGLPPQVIAGVRKSLVTERRELTELLEAYDKAKAGDFALMKDRAASDIGALLVVARITKGWSQKDLARRLGLQEQQIQRYEAERYRGISLGGLIRVAGALRIVLSADLSRVVGDPWAPSYEISKQDAQRVLKHARSHGWLKSQSGTDDKAIAEIKRLVAEHVSEHGTPSLLRTGLSVHDHTDDWALLAWKAQVTRRAKAIIEKENIAYRPLDVSWLVDLVRLSCLDDGPKVAVTLLRQHGIILVAEPHISGMKVDGAAFLVDGVPVIGLTLLRDTIDNFWFTLLHEVGHVILHYRTGLASGFFDDVELRSVDEFETEANSFASNLLIPDEVWNRSPARIAKTAEPIERFSKQLEIAPAIAFGRIRMERGNYAIFSDRIGRGKIRKHFFGSSQEM